MMTNVEIRTIGSGSYVVMLDRVVKMIRKKRNDYSRKYYQDPKYIKVPDKFSRCLRMCENYIAQRDEPDTFMGMVICETCAIRYPEQIEVF